ncbi:MAG: hypothetical protein IJR88_03830 [Clostridia bacterium]|nr:hypothetical protein [Clostridia bacterium]
MKRSLLRIFALCLSLLFLMQAGAFSAFAVTDEEIEQYEKDLAAYLEWQEYRKNETAYWAYQAALETYAAENEAYLQYQGVIEAVKQKLPAIDYIFIEDARGWALTNSINLGVSAVEQFDDATQYEDIIRQFKDVLQEAKTSSAALKGIFSGYQAVLKASYSSEYESLKARFAFYTDNYQDLIDNSKALCVDLISIYLGSSIVEKGIADKEKERDMEGRYLKLVYQLYVLFCCLNDDVALDDPDSDEILAGLSLNEVLGASSSQIASDTDDASPESISFPAAELTPAVEPEKVDKPTQPDSVEITVEPTCPEGYTPGVHFHKWNDGEVTTAATCTTPGVRTYTCTSCGETKTETITAQGHDYSVVVTQATCTTGGYTTRTCSRCGGTVTDSQTGPLGHAWGTPVVTPASCMTPGSKVFTCANCGAVNSEKIDPLGHQYTAVVTNPTCEAGGYTTHTCSKCGDSYVDTNTQPLGHVWNAGTVTKTATCTEAGEKTFTCTRCSITQTEPIPAPGHSYQNTVTPSTCEAEGYTTHVCTGCGYTYVDSGTPALGHSWKTGTEIKATCTEAGEKNSTCTRCGQTKKETVAALGHDYTTVVTKPTCETGGYTTHTCSRCQDSYTDSEVAAKGHNWNNGVITKPATDDQPGEKTFTCKTCGKTRVEETPATGHDYETTVTLPTCTEQGYTTHTCKHAGCGNSYIDQYVPALGHDWDNGSVTTTATCTTSGVKTFTCSRCKGTRTEEIPATGHDYKTSVVPQTCDEQGYTAHTCSRCGDVYKDAYTDALGHIWNNGFVTTAATCTTPGVKTFTCSRCNGTKTEEIPATGHDYKPGVKHDPTCAERGYTAHTCSRCGDVYKDEFVNPLGHIWGDGVVTAEPTCTESGTKTFTCSRCNGEMTEGILALGHEYSDVITAPTCTEAGYTTHTCSRCEDTYVDAQTDPLGHVWNSGVVTVQPTEIIPGTKTFTCARCGGTRTEEIPALEETTVDPNPVQQLGRASAAKQDLKNSVSGTYTTGLSNEDVTAEISVAAAKHMLETGVQSVSLQISHEEDGDHISFVIEKGTPHPSARLFRLNLDEGKNEGYRYAYFKKKNVAVLQSSDPYAYVTLSSDPHPARFDFDQAGSFGEWTQVLEGEETTEWVPLPYGQVVMTPSDEVLRVKSFYIYKSEDINGENCYLQALPTSAIAGETVEINPPCDFGYEVTNLMVQKENGEAVPVSGKTFVMPESPVTISFTVEKIVYRIKYVFDGKVIAEQEYGLGETIVPPAEDTLPKKESDEEYNYSFLGWSPELKTATGDEREITVEARFAKTAVNYQVEMYDLRWAFIKPILLLGSPLLLIAGGVVFLIVRRKKKKKKAEQKEESEKTE